MTFKEYLDSKYFFTPDYPIPARRLEILGDAFIDWVDLTYGQVTANQS